MNKLNLLIIGNGHFATGSTVLEGKTATDKDMGILLPSALELRRQGLVDNIFVAARDGRKLSKLPQKFAKLSRKYGWDPRITLFPKTKTHNEHAYLDALQHLPKPAGVLIAIPDFLHKKVVIDVLQHTAHFLVVKPVVTTMKDFSAIARMMKKKNGVLGLVDYHKVYDEANLILKDEYEQGMYGDLQHIMTKQTQRRDMLKIFGDWAGTHGHNINHYLGSHYIHMVGYITQAVPLNVRATAQWGVARKEFGINTPDLFETMVQWRAKNATTFTSYHLAGWADPSETAGMTYQEMHLIGTKGHIESDQRNRGFETTLVGTGTRIINPYFFHLHKNPDGQYNFDSKYGFKSVKTFVQAALRVASGESPNKLGGFLPTVEESRTVTAILEAADKSLANGSTVIHLS